MRAGLAHSIHFDPADPSASLSGLPEAPAVFALCAADPAAEPYLGKTPNLRRRLMRFLRGPQDGKTSRRLQLAHLVDQIEYTVTGSAFESSLCLYQASLRAFGQRAQKRLRLRPPAFLRMSVDNPYPRVYVTSKISKTAANALFGPFPSRAAAERYADEMLNLFLLRRCSEELDPDPAFPGCVYSEMKMCLAPCFKGCSDERYQQEASEVFAFLATRGGSMISRLENERNAASEAMEFERAAAIHQRMQKVQGVAHLVSEAVRPLAELSGILVQPSAEPGHVALFALRRGVWSGPVLYSIVGMRLANERSGSSSLFAHPVALEPVPLEGVAALPAKDVLELRLEEALRALAQSALKTVSAHTLSDHLALFTQWFYRPRSSGEMVFAAADGAVPRKPLLRAISRVAARAHSSNPEELAKPPIQWHA
ncbi:MAG: UvrB/UvrC motif-containing protein [Acidobacteriaceae bacterium]